MLFSILVLVLIGLWYYYCYVLRYRFAKDIPSVKPCYPVIGNGLNFLWKSPAQLFQSALLPFQENDRWFTIWLGPQMLLCTSHPQLAEAVLSHPKCLEKPYFYGFLKLDHGILTRKYDRWKRYRRALSPAFSTNKIKGAIPLFANNANAIVNEMNSMMEKDAEISLLPLFRKCTLNLIITSCIGSDAMEEHQALKSTILSSLETLLQMISARAINVLHHWDWIYKFTKNGATETKARLECYRSLDKFLASRKAALFDNCTDPSDTILDRLFRAENGVSFTDTEIVHNFYSLIGAGNDTTAHSMGHTCLFLAMHHTVQEQVYRELCQVLPDSEEAISEEHLKRLKVLDCVLKESLRLAPGGATVARQTGATIVIEGQQIPAGTPVVVSLFAMHRRKDFWGEDADRFDPTRFLPERSVGRPACAFMPFNTGSRDCLGWRYALLSMKVILAQIIRSFTLRTDPTMNLLSFQFDVALKQEGNYIVHATKRK